MRRLLTRDYVNRVRHTRKGERWIADTRVRGFGIRVWPQGKAFAIRTATSDGRKVRRTICIARGEYLEIARDQAIAEIRAIQGRSTLETVRQKWAKLIPTLPMNRWIELVQEVKRREGADRTYLDAVFELYARFAEPKIGKILVGELQLDLLISSIEAAGNTPGQARKLQSYLHYVLSFAGEFCRHPYDLAWRMNERSNYTYVPNPPPTLGLKPDDFRPLFRRLASESNERQIALFLLFVFFTATRPKEALRAKWEQLHSNRFFPVRMAEWRAFADSTELNDDLSYILGEIRSLNGLTSSPFLFPSLRSTKSGHLTGYQKYWRKVRVECGLPDAPLFYLVRHFKNPWRYQMSDLSFAPDTMKAIIKAEMSRVVRTEPIANKAS